MSIEGHNLSLGVQFRNGKLNDVVTINIPSKDRLSIRAYGSIGLTSDKSVPMFIDKEDGRRLLPANLEEGVDPKCLDGCKREGLIYPVISGIDSDSSVKAYWCVPREVKDVLLISRNEELVSREVLDGKDNVVGVIKEERM